jgi:NADH-quinone oxidoreductase subunit E
MASPLLTAEEQRVFDDRLAEILAHYPTDRKSAAMLPALHPLQSMKGWLPPDGM